jgi:glycerate dehydrogenase
MKIVILDGYCANPGDLSWESLKKYGEVVVYDRTSPKDVISRTKDADIVLTNKVVIDENTLCALPRLKYIGVLATGWNVVDVPTAVSHGVVVTNIPEYSTDSVVQSVFSLILTISNRVEHYTQLNKDGRWSKCADFCYTDTPLHELSGKTIGVIGLGHIGFKVAKIALSFGMDVFAFTSKNASDLPDGIQKTTLDGLFGISDILTLHCPLNDTTREMINSDTLKKMKPNAILINTSRGPLVNESDVADALLSGQLAAYGADVMSQEPPSADNPLLFAPNAFITPHIAWATYESRKRLISIAADNIRAFVEGHPQNVIGN